MQADTRPVSRRRAPPGVAFARWFAGSRIVDPNGEPLLLFHGTKADFEIFQPSRFGEFGPGIYLTDSPRDATEFGDAKGDGGPIGTRLLAVYASVRNPYTSGVHSFWADFNRDDGDANGVLRARAAGYDGVLTTRPDRYYDDESRAWVDRGPPITHVVAFSPERVKSAIGNPGTYESTNPSLIDDGPSAMLLQELQSAPDEPRLEQEGFGM